jgi:drug/metabolite transporter (DMT)-like permease
MDNLPPTSLKRKIFGVALIIFGLFALVTPLTPGAWLALIGMELLGFHTLWGRKAMHYWRKLHPKKPTKTPPVV